MELRVRVARAHPSGDGVADESSDTEGWTESFADWIAEDPRPARSAVVRRERVPSGDGGMSSDLLPWIGLAVDSGAFLAALISLFGDFRGSLRPAERSAVRLIVEHEGRRYVVHGDTAEEVARAARALGIVPEPARGGGGDGAAP
ncbi:effector-associated constant component EACC1 [Streptomyces naphthomycinicus]|uniref:effector-associated constant component EACC1 n=1 Tax=Streptomyces naphthomycinicus TaxID=2872625 RepID=UPI001CEC6B29|nr:hypothetical protein [Streptomyces sp. TML10]